MRIAYSESTFDDLARIESWITAESPKAAKRVAAEIIAAVDMLEVFPLLGRPGAVAGTRESVVARLPFIIVYRLDVARDEIVVIAIFHAAQDRSDWRF